MAKKRQLNPKKQLNQPIKISRPIKRKVRVMKPKKDGANPRNYGRKGGDNDDV